MIRTLLAWLPAVVLASAFAAICIHFHTLWPFNLQVHEDGRHTLLGTIFYFEHAAGELPVDLLLSAAIAGAMLRYAGPTDFSAPILFVFGVALSIDAVILSGSVLSVGFPETRDWLFQFHTREGSPLEFGSHWRYHLLSEMSLLLLAMGLSGAVGNSRGNSRLLYGTWIAFAMLSILFGVTAAPFIDARYLGHQARETLTHTLTTVPLGVAVCAFLARKNAPFKRKPATPILWAGMGFIALAIYQGAGALLGGVREHSQTNDPVRLLCTHFFEHTFSYLVVASHAALLYLMGSRQGQSA